MAMYFVIYNAEVSPLEDELVKKLEKFKYSQQLFENGWIIKTPKKIAELNQDLTEFLGTEDRWLIVEILRFNANLDPVDTQWLKTLL